MSNITSKSRIAILAMVAMLAVSAGAVFAAPSFDTSSSDATSSTSEVTDGMTIQHDANSTDNYTVEGIFANSTDPGMKIVVNDSSNPADNQTVYRNESMTNQTAGTEGSHWNGSFTEADIADVPVEINDNVTVDVVLYNTTNTSDATSIQVYLETNETRSVTWVDESVAEDNDDVTIATDNGTEIPGLGVTVPGTANDKTEFEFERNVTSNTNEVIVILANDSSVTDFDGAFDDVDSESTETFTSAITGDVAITTVDGEYIKPYNAGLPSDLDSDTQTVQYTTVGGQQAVVFEVDSTDTATVSADSDGGLTSYINAFSLGGALSFGVLIVFGHTKRKRTRGN